MTQETTPALLVMPLDREAILRAALHRLTAAPPEAKGMDPKARAARYRAELERRAAFAREALANAQ